MSQKCQAVYKTGVRNGEKCTYNAKPGSPFCGVHKNFVQATVGTKKPAAKKPAAKPAAKKPAAKPAAKKPAAKPATSLEDFIKTVKNLPKRSGPSQTVVLEVMPIVNGHVPAPEKLALVDAHPKRVEEIVKDSLYGFDVHWFYSVGNLVAVAVSPNSMYLGESTGLQGITDHLKKNYGLAAVDGWMGGDISLPKGSDDAELDITLRAIF